MFHREYKEKFEYRACQSKQEIIASYYSFFKNISSPEIKTENLYEKKISIL